MICNTRNKIKFKKKIIKVKQKNLVPLTMFETLIPLDE